MGSARCLAAMDSEALRSAMVLATLRIRSCARAFRSMRRTAISRRAFAGFVERAEFAQLAR
jgi:hypothetical protein